MSAPNIIFIICHDLGKHLGCYGAKVHSPHLDRFARRGLKFNKAFCSATACSPSRGCIMTGQYAHTNGMIGLSHFGWSLANETRTIVDDFNDHGYETVHIGHSHERYMGHNHYQIDTEESAERSRSDYAVDDAIAYLRGRQKSEKPFYLNIGVTETHAYHFNERYDTVYGGEVPHEDVWLPEEVPNAGPLRKQFARFQSAIGFLDREFGRLIGELEELGRLDDTLVVFTTDHGIPNARSKGTVYDRGMEVALLMHLPRGMRNEREIDFLIPNIDYRPTFLRAANIEVPEECEGRSFWPLLASKFYKPHDAIFTERNFHVDALDRQGDPADLYDPQRAIRTDRFHYIRRFLPDTLPRDWMPWEYPPFRNVDNWGEIWPIRTAPRAAEELYDVKKDPREFTDLATDPDYAAIKAELAHRLEDWMKATHDFVLEGRVPRPCHPFGWGYPRDPRELEAAKARAYLRAA